MVRTERRADRLRDTSKQTSPQLYGRSLISSLNTFLFQRTSSLTEAKFWRMEDHNLLKPAKDLPVSKNNLWRG